MLTAAYRRGWTVAKLALQAPSPADVLVANVEQGQDMPPPGGPQAPPMVPPPFPGQPGALGGDLQAKAAALGLKDMLFFEKMMGQDEARSMFQGIEKQMSGQGGGFHGTLNIGPQGVTRSPLAKPMPMPQRPAAVPPPIPAAARPPMKTAFEKEAVSGGMYARALGNAAQRSGGRVAPQILSGMSQQPRAAASPFLSGAARTPGAVPSRAEPGVSQLLERTPWAGSEHGGSPGAVSAFNQNLQAAGKTHAQPGLNAQIRENFGPNPYDRNGQGPTVRAQVPQEPTVSGKRPMNPALARTQVGPAPAF